MCRGGAGFMDRLWRSWNGDWSGMVFGNGIQVILKTQTEQTLNVFGKGRDLKWALFFNWKVDFMSDQRR